jgi:hypothetical protein
MVWLHRHGSAIWKSLSLEHDVAKKNIILRLPYEKFTFRPSYVNAFSSEDISIPPALPSNYLYIVDCTQFAIFSACQWTKCLASLEYFAGHSIHNPMQFDNSTTVDQFFLSLSQCLLAQSRLISERHFAGHSIHDPMQFDNSTTVD